LLPLTAREFASVDKHGPLEITISGFNNLVDLFLSILILGFEAEHPAARILAFGAEFVLYYFPN
jgi:hypothetical protein